MIHILVIDSNEDRQRWFKDALATLPDCHLDTATSSHGALLHLRSRRYDLVLIEDFLGSDSKTGAQLIDEALGQPAAFFRPKRVWAHADSVSGGSEIAMWCSVMHVPVLRRSFSELTRGTAFLDKVTDWLQLAEKKHGSDNT